MTPEQTQAIEEEAKKDFAKYLVDNKDKIAKYQAMLKHAETELES